MNGNKIPESHKVPLFLTGLGTSSPLEHILAAVLTKDTDQLFLKGVSADLIKASSATIMPDHCLGVSFKIIRSMPCHDYIIT